MKLSCAYRNYNCCLTRPEFNRNYCSTYVKEAAYCMTIAYLSLIKLSVLLSLCSSLLILTGNCHTTIVELANDLCTTIVELLFI